MSKTLMPFNGPVFSTCSVISAVPVSWRHNIAIPPPKPSHGGIFILTAAHEFSYNGAVPQKIWQYRGCIVEFTGDSGMEMPDIHMFLPRGSGWQRRKRITGAETSFPLS
jgi:hypothetical protein